MRRALTHTHTIKPPRAGVQLVGHTSIKPNYVTALMQFNKKSINADTVPFHHDNTACIYSIAKIQGNIFTKSENVWNFMNTELHIFSVQALHTYMHTVVWSVVPPQTKRRKSWAALRTREGTARWSGTENSQLNNWLAQSSEGAPWYPHWIMRLYSMDIYKKCI